MKLKNFGKRPRKKSFSPPKATRGGFKGAINKEQEMPLTGMVQNLKAAKGEERLSRTVYKAMNKGLVTDFKFRYSPGMKKGVPGWKELDLLVVTPSRPIAISVKGASFVHLDTGAQDAWNELLLAVRLRKEGYPVFRIESVYDYELNTQEDADKVAKRLGFWR